jgi:hypothetical protein
MNLARYHSRSPRYILQPYDNTLVRIAGPRQVPWEEGTEIRNISLSGLAFTAPRELCPIIGESIKIQFETPGSQQLACFGLVTRLEPINGSEMLVGVQFQKLELAHKIVLLQGLAKKLKEQQERKKVAEMSQWHLRFRNKWKQIAIMTSFLVLWLMLMKLFLM